MNGSSILSDTIFALVTALVAACFLISAINLTLHGRLQRWLRLGLSVVVGLCTLALLVRWVEAGLLEVAVRQASGLELSGWPWLSTFLSHPPFTNFFEVLLYMAWALMVVALVIEVRFALRSFALLCLGSALLFLGIAFLVLDSTINPLVPALQSWWLHIHVILATLSYAAAAGAAFISFLYLVAERRPSRSFLVAGSLALLALFLILGKGLGPLLGTPFALVVLADGAPLLVPMDGDTVTLSVGVPELSRWLAVGVLIAVLSTALSMAAAAHRTPLMSKLALGAFTIGQGVLWCFTSHLLVTMTTYTPVDIASKVASLGITVPLSLGIRSAPWALAIAVAGLACTVVLTLAIVRRELLVGSAPDCAALDIVAYRLLAVGFATLTLVLVTGSVWAHHAWGRFWSWDPKETWSLITWLVDVFYLHARLHRSWSGRSLAVIAIIGFIIVLFTFLGVNVGLSGVGLHVYGSAR